MSRPDPAGRTVDVRRQGPSEPAGREHGRPALVSLPDAAPALALLRPFRHTGRVIC